MSKIKNEILKNLEKRLKMSNPKKWSELSDEERSNIILKYYEIRDTDYQNINFLLREHAESRRQFFMLFAGVFIGILANPISNILLKYLPSATIVDDIKTLVLFALGLLILVLAINRASAKSLDDENVIERLLEIAKQTPPQKS